VAGSVAPGSRGALSTLRAARVGVWWSWGESNPRPKAFVRQIYTLSWLICF